MSKNTLNMRSKIIVRWTTAPSDMGYGGQPTGWELARGQIMSLRKACSFAGDLARQIGEGTYRLIKYSHRGRIIDRGEMDETINDAEYDKWQARRP